MLTAHQKNIRKLRHRLISEAFFFKHIFVILVEMLRVAHYTEPVVSLHDIVDDAHGVGFLVENLCGEV